MNAGRELDALIATKVMGWTNVGCEKNAQHEEFVPHGCDPLHPAAFPFGRSQLPHYSTDMADAWDVVEKLSPRERGERSHIACLNMPHSPALYPDDAPVWWVEWFDGDQTLDAVDAPTAALAICRAALKVVGGAAVLSHEGVE